MRGHGLGIVIQVGPESELQVGDTVKASYGNSSSYYHWAFYDTISQGWTEYAVMNDKDVEKIMYGSLLFLYMHSHL